MENLDEKKKVIQDYKKLLLEINSLVEEYLNSFEKWSIQQSEEKIAAIQKKVNERRRLEKAHKYLLAKER